MAKTRDLKRRIRSIRNTMQLTRAMKMVSAAKLRRSQERMFAARPYARHLQAVLQSLATRANPEIHPLLELRPERRTELVVITADRGLCGSFNTNILKRATSFLLEEAADRERILHLVGRKGRDFFRRRPWPVQREWTDVTRSVDYTIAAEIGQDVIARYVAGEIDSVYLVYNEFKSALAQKPTVTRLLPIERRSLGAAQASEQDYIYEPDPATLFDRLLPHHIEVQIYHALLESVAAEHAARMAAMSSATTNAGELIDKLTLRMNRMRQASITTEIIEVVSGANALG